MAAKNNLEDRPFSYVGTVAGTVRISFRNKLVSTIKGKDAAKFLDAVNALSEDEQQIRMAKITRHFKHGTERAAKNRRADR